MALPLRPASISGTLLMPGGRLHAGTIRVRAGWIQDVELGDIGPRDGGPDAIRLRRDEVIAPAFIDVHCHGAAGGAARDGVSGIERMAVGLAQHGVGAFLATLMTAPGSELVAGVSAAAGFSSDRDRDRGGVASALLGVHLEGPVLSPARSAGHEVAALLGPEAFRTLVAACGDAWGAVRLVTLAPELPGALRLVSDLVRQGVAVSVGHTDAPFATAAAAYAEGATSTTHLFNGMPPLLHRAPGPVGAALAHAPFIELIADGVHVDAALLAPLGRAIGSERLMLVSDALPLAASRLRHVAVPGSSVRVTRGAARHADGTLAGGRLLLDGLVERAVAAGLPLADALRAASENPARLLGVSDRGVIAPGARADLVVVSAAGRLRRVMLGRPGSAGASAGRTTAIT